MVVPARMSKVNILIQKSNSNDLIKRLHEEGLLEIERTSSLDISEERMHPDVEIFAKYDLRLSRIIEILKNYHKEKRKIFSSDFEKKKVRKKSEEEKIREAEKILSEIENEVLLKENEIKELEGEIFELEERIKKLEYLAYFNIDISWLKKSKYIIVKCGLCTDINSLKVSDEIYFEYKKIGKKKENLWVVLIVAHSSLEKEISQIKNFEEIYIEGEGRVSEVIKNIRNEIEEKKRKRKEIEEWLSNLYKEKKLDLMAIKEEIEIEKERKEIYEKFWKTNYTYLIEGWCLSENSEKVKKIVEEVTEGNSYVEIEEFSRDSEKPPVHLKNPRWAKTFEMLLEFFAVPRYNEINPTIFIGISFIIFFSLMLGDAGYGLVMFLLSIFAYIKFKKSEAIRSWAVVGILLGLGNIINGLIFNSFFGDFIPRYIYKDATKLLYSANIFGISLPIDAIHKPILILSITLIIGLIHLNLGLILGMYQNIIRGNKKKIFEEQISFIMLEIGAGMLIGERILHLWHIEGVMLYLSFIFVLIGLIFIFKRKGPMGFFDITGFMGDWLSYSRILALGLATTGMAMTINIFGQIIPTILSLIGAILAPVVLIIAHFANIILQSLGAGIHSLRLQYVEFFNRFYEGGGKKFIPFRIKRKYTEEIT
ncbi:MAG: V-type ATP synthase subunit I [Thermoplasmatales archaeon]|nr:V-type ATP synthase subunit I [Thermoplasmatales archaeon]